jgi:hypothetical protein
LSSFADAGIDQALDAGISHTAVAAQVVTGLAFRIAGAGVNETAIVDLPSPWLVVEFAFEVLAAADENDSLLIRGIAGRHSSRFQRINEELRVR